MSSKPVAVRETDLFDQLFDVFIQCVELSLHGQDNCDQFFAAHISQLIQCMFCHFPYSFNSLYPLYRIAGKKANGKRSGIRHSAYACDRVGVRGAEKNGLCTKNIKKRVCLDTGSITAFHQKDCVPSSPGGKVKKHVGKFQPFAQRSARLLGCDIFDLRVQWI